MHLPLGILLVSLVEALPVASFTWAFTWSLQVIGGRVIPRDYIIPLLAVRTAFALCTVRFGVETCADMSLFGQSKRDFLEIFLAARNGIPTSGTFSRVFRLLVPKAFRTWFLDFMLRFAQSCEGVLAGDGSRCAFPMTLKRPQLPLHLVSARAFEQRLALGEPSVDIWSNEIMVVLILLQVLALMEVEVTAGAMRCHPLLEVIDPESPVSRGGLRAGL